MNEHPATQARELRNLAKQLAMWLHEPVAKVKAERIAERAEQLLGDLSGVLDEPAPRIPSNKSEWD